MQTGENIFTEEEKREIQEKKFLTTTTNNIYQKKLTIEKIRGIQKQMKKNI